MGQCYSINLKIKAKDEIGAVKALQNKIARGDQDHTDYSIDHYKQIGIGTETLPDLLRIFFGGWQGRLEEQKGILHSAFDCCYGWEGTMIEAFNELAPFLKDGSYIKIYPDSGVDHAVVRNGAAVWLR